MPVDFDTYEARSDDVAWALDPDSNAYAVLSFLAEHPDTGFTPKEIQGATDVPRGSVGTTLRRLEDRDLVRHKEPYWAASQDGIDAYAAVHTSLRTVEEATTYDWGDVDPESYRIGLDAVSESATDERD